MCMFSIIEMDLDVKQTVASVSYHINTEVSAEQKD